jgi:poly(A) polymerase
MEETPTRVPPLPAEAQRDPEKDEPHADVADAAAGSEHPDAAAGPGRELPGTAAPAEAGPSGSDAAEAAGKAPARRRRRRRRGRGAQASDRPAAGEQPSGPPAGPEAAVAAATSHRADDGHPGRSRAEGAPVRGAEGRGAPHDAHRPRHGAADDGDRPPRAGEESHRSDRAGDHARRPRRGGDLAPRPHRAGDEAHPSPHVGGRPFALDPDLPNPAHEPEIPVERLDADAVKVISRLRHMGHQAYFVGGCVRDLMLGLKPKDFDIATDAHPGEVRAVFRNCRLIGRRFRLAHVYFRGGKIIEVATFRANPIDVADDVPSDADLLITRDNVFGTAEEDARRRDFTVNGLFYDPFLGEVIDYVGGRADLEARRIATIGDPEIRMREDPVRALRAIRFAARLGFAIEPEAFAAMRRSAAELARCAPARVLEETFKILRCGNAARAFELLRAAGALPMVLPALAEALDAGEAATRARFQAHLVALDALVRSGAEVSEAVLLGALLMHLRRDEPAGEGEPRRPGGAGAAGESAADQLLGQLVQTARLPRRMAERTRLAMGTQRVFRGPARRRRRRGGGLGAQAYFQDALQLLEITVRATGEGAEALARWRTEGEAHASAWAEAEAEAEVRGAGDRGVGHRGGGSGGTRDRGTSDRSARDRGAGEGDRGGELEDGGSDIPAYRQHPGEGPGERRAAGEVDVSGASGGDEAAPRRRRRRRGGRRRRRRGAGAGAPSAGGA